MKHPHQPGVLKSTHKRSIAIGITLFLCFALHYSYALYHKNTLTRRLMQTPGMTVNSFSAKAEAILSYHPELGNEAMLLEMYPLVRSYLAEPQADRGVQGHQLVSLMERYEPHRPRTLLNLGASYLALWADYGQDADYQKTVGYFEEVQKLRPNDPYSLYCLYTTYTLHGDPQAQEMKDLIQKYWGDVPKSDSCGVPSAE